MFQAGLSLLATYVHIVAIALISHHHFQEVDFSSISSWLSELAPTNSDSLVFAILPESQKDWVSSIQSFFNRHDIALLGAIFPALLTEAGFVTSGVTFVYIPKATTHFLVNGFTSDSNDAAVRICEALRAGPAMPSLAKNHQLFLVFDSMCPNTGSILAQLFDLLKRQFNYAGVSAGSETFQPMPCLFDNHQLISNGAIGIVLEAGIQVAVQHNYPVTKSLMRATSTVGNRIDKIDGEPAMSVYQRVIASEFGIVLTPETFYEYAVHYPFGLISSLDVLVRIPVAFNDDGSIFCVGEVPPSSMLRLLKAPSLADSNCVRNLVDFLGGQQSNPLMVFYCAGRRMHFGSDATSEIRELLEKSGTTTIFGALSLGEIRSDSEFGVPEFHNAAVVCAR